MTRRRLTWNGRNASAPPAMPGYQEPSIHPAAYPDPEADAYENGDTSAWAEDPHPGPYTNPMHPALPGTEAPMGHPATDPAHYFPAGVSKQASRQIRAAMEAKAARCIRIAQSMLGRKASVSAIEDQALDLMNLTERQIQAALSRLADDGMSQDVSTESSMDLLAIENMTLTPQRTSEEAMLAEMMADEEPKAEEAMLAEMMADEGKLSEQTASKLSEQIAGLLAALGPKAEAKMSDEVKAEAMLANMLAGASRLASKQMPGNQNAPEHYNYREQGVLASKKSEESVADEALLAEMVADEEPKAGKKAALLLRAARMIAAKKSEEAAKKSEETADEETADEEVPPAKKAAFFARQAAYWQRVAKKSEETADETAEETADETADEEPKAGKKANGMTAELKAALAELLAEEAPVADDLMSEEFSMADEITDDIMGDLLAEEGPVADDLMSLYSMKLAGKESDEVDADEVDADEEPKAGKKAALRPQARKASNGVKTLGAVSKVASGEENDLSKLWQSAPDVSKVFG